MCKFYGCTTILPPSQALVGLIRNLSLSHETHAILRDHGCVPRLWHYINKAYQEIQRRAGPGSPPVCVVSLHLHTPTAWTHLLHGHTHCVDTPTLHGHTHENMCTLVAHLYMYCLSYSYMYRETVTCTWMAHTTHTHTHTHTLDRKRGLYKIMNFMHCTIACTCTYVVINLVNITRFKE